MPASAPMGRRFFTGERTLDASAVADYLAPLDRWLTDRNKGEKCGW
jgi:peptidyl-dipeptidase A